MPGASGGALLDEAWIVALRVQLESIGDELGRLRGGLGDQGQQGQCSPAEVLAKLTCSVCDTHTPSERSCVICLVDFAVGDAIAEIPACHHVFHTRCLSQWLEHRQACPMCRFDLRSLLPACSGASGSPQLLQFQAHIGEIEGRMQVLRGRIQTLGAVTEVGATSTGHAALPNGGLATHRASAAWSSASSSLSGLDTVRSADSERLSRAPRTSATVSQAELLEARGDESVRSREGGHPRLGLPGLVARTRALVAAERLGHTPWAPPRSRAGRRPPGAQARSPIPTLCPVDGPESVLPWPREDAAWLPRQAQSDRPARSA